ncbi:hypothetical protein C0Q44_05975 [Paenibacillus sp. PCH8]|uniref:RCC1 domain-containing protein n=1 Tax=Paenibacillus sp. PCH8 TaxID=2066524 RepID=UPI000CF9E69C|nr:S-layer homology domain-containing protein [Paenibacillus sp. PCH8]PQP84142.1 hypothetical protein C0Q44_05975 [Paenibacillus sp. PCH8]
MYFSNRDLKQKSKKSFFSKLIIVTLLVSIIQPMLTHSTHVSAASMQGIYSFGAEGNGRLGVWAYNTTIPHEIEDLQDIKGVAAGAYHSLALTTDGDVYSFGAGNSGQLGLGSDLGSKHTPTKIANLAEVKQVAAGRSHSLALTVTGSVYSFGGGGVNDNFGQLGHGDWSGKNTPTKIEGLPEISAIAAGQDYSLALSVTGEVYSFGRNDYEQLGYGGTQTSPKKIDALSHVTVKAIAAGRNHSLALTTDGEVYSFGAGSSGQLGHGNTINKFRPEKIAGLTDISAIAAGGAHSLVLTTDGKVLSFGGNEYNPSLNNNYGQLGHGDTINQSSPKRIEAVNDITVKSIVAGSENSFVLTADGEVYAFGAGTAGKLGLGTTNNELTPKKMEFAKKVTAIAAGDDHTLMMSTIDSKIDPIDIVYDKYVQDENHTDKTISLQLNGHSFTGITNEATTLVENQDYTVDGSSVTLKKEYLNTLEVDIAATLTFAFDSGLPQNLLVYVNDSTPDDADLTDLQVDGTSVTDFASYETGPYEVSIPYTQTSVAVTHTTSDSAATVQVAGNKNLVVGANTVTVTVISQKGTQTVYTITVTRAAAPTGNGGGSNGGSGSNGTSSGGASTTPTTPITSTNGTITVPVGRDGEIKLGGEVTVSIPSGAADQPLTMTIEKLKDIAALEQQGIIFVSPVYELLSNVPGSFNKPVTLTFQFDASKVKEGQHASIYYYDENQQRWIEIGGKANGNTITAAVDRLAKFAVLIVDKQPDIAFSDIAGHWAEEQIYQAVDQGIVTGYSDKSFRANAKITRAEFTVMLMNALKPAGDGQALSFSDNDSIGVWAQRAVAQSVAAEIVTGYNDSTFRPTANITRSEMAAMIARVYGSGLATVDSTDFADDNDIPTWAKPAIQAVKEAGITQGIGNNLFAPHATASRAEAITMILNLLKVQ